MRTGERTRRRAVGYCWAGGTDLNGASRGAHALLRIDTALYPIENIAKVAYAFTDRWWIRLERKDEITVEVHIRPKVGSVSADILLCEFSNALLDQAVRRHVANETLAIRETLVHTALAEAKPRLPHNFPPQARTDAQRRPISGVRPYFEPASAYADPPGTYRLLPFRFTALPGVTGKVLIVSETGEYLFLDRGTFNAFVERRLDPTSSAYFDLEAKHFLSGRPIDTLAAHGSAVSKRKSFLRGGPSLHIFVTTLRCDHSCPYCQVSRQSADCGRFDMSTETVDAAVARLFEIPSPALTVEFQGGEPLLAFNIIEHTVEAISARNAHAGRTILFTIVSTLHHVDDRILAFFKTHNFRVSTSLDGPAWLHDANRPSRNGDALRAL